VFDTDDNDRWEMDESLICVVEETGVELIEVVIDGALVTGKDDVGIVVILVLINVGSPTKIKEKLFIDSVISIQNHKNYD
jgi:hypothetical protein